MKILVTGGRGYIGERLCQFLVSTTEHKLVIGTRNPNISCNSQIEEKTTDWDSQSSLDACCEGVDVVIHLAGMNAKDSLEDPVLALYINGVGTAKLLAAAKVANVRRFIYISTAHIYGAPLVGEISELTCPKPSHPYATSHRAAEDVVLASKGIEVVVLRLSNSFGAPISAKINCWDLLFNDLCKQAVVNKKMILRTSGLQKRDFIPLTDVCRAIEHVLSLSIDKLDKKIFNLGGNWSISIMEAAEIIANRFEIMTGFRPAVLRNLEFNIDNTINYNFQYHIKRLLDTGFSLNIDKYLELDRLIKFCMNSFSCNFLGTSY